MKITSAQSKYFNGYKGSKQTNISPSEGIDVKETVRNLTSMWDFDHTLIEGKDGLALFSSI
jgi:hypothetical protein